MSVKRPHHPQTQIIVDSQCETLLTLYVTLLLDLKERDFNLNEVDGACNSTRNCFTMFTLCMLLVAGSQMTKGTLPRIRFLSPSETAGICVSIQHPQSGSDSTKTHSDKLVRRKILAQDQRVMVFVHRIPIGGTKRLLHVLCFTHRKDLSQ